MDFERGRGKEKRKDEEKLGKGQEKLTTQKFVGLELNSPDKIRVWKSQ